MDERFLSKLKDFADVTKEELENFKPFHWGFEFYNVFSGSQNKENRKFDIIIGNPPYGDLLGEKEKEIISNYTTHGYREISANFIERQLQLLGDKAYFGNITILRVVYDSTFGKLRRLLRNNFETTWISCFERRPSQLFKDAQIQVGILIGDKTHELEGNREVKTSRFIRMNRKERKNLADLLNDVTHHDVNGFILTDTIGGEKNGYEILPKIGCDTNASILQKLKSYSERTVGDAINGNGDYIVYRIRGGGYHPTCMLEELYKSETVRPIKFDTELERNLTFLLVNSQMFYFYWMIYSNARHLNTGMIKRFPLPPLRDIRQYKEDINKMTEKLWKAMKNYFDEEKHYFYTSHMKSLLEEVTDLLSEIYGLTSEETEYIKKYDSSYIWTKS